jgi:hypothetical protein
MTITQILSGDPSYSNSKLQPRELAEAIMNGLRPEPRPSSIEGDQYDGLWYVMQQGWAGDPSKRATLQDFLPRTYAFYKQKYVYDIFFRYQIGIASARSACTR